MSVKLLGPNYSNFILISGEYRDQRFLELDEKIDNNKKTNREEKRKRYQERRNQYLLKWGRPLEY